MSPSTTFAEYFERQDDAFKRSWLGAKRYEAYRNGAKFGDLAKPATTYRATPADLTPPTEKPKETAASDDKTSNAQTPKIDRSTLPDFDGSSKQNAWAAEIREKELDEWEAVALSERVKRSVEPATSKRRFFYNAEAERQKELVRAEMKKRGDAVVLAELEAAAREIAAEIFANPSARDWIDGRGGPSVWARAVGEARRRIATTGSAKPPKQAFELPTLDLPELKTPRLSGSPRQIEWAEDLRRRAVRDLTEERTAETGRDYLRAWRNWSSRRDGKRFRDALPELEKTIAEVGDDDAAARILGRETLLKARECVEAWDDSRDWIDLKTGQKVGLNAYAAQKIAGTPKEAAAILRRYAADAKKAKSLQNDAAQNKRQPAKTTPPTEPDAPQTPSVWSPSGPIKDAQSFLEALREYRAPKMAPKDAQKAEKEAQEYVKERAAAYVVCHRFRLSYQRYEKTRKKDVKAALLPQLQQELTAAITETRRVGALRNARHGTVDRAVIFDWLFPDNGGSVIFDDTKRAEVENVFRKNFSKKGAVILSNGKNATAEDAAGVTRSVLELYNKIGRSLGFDDAPRFANVVFRKLPLGTNSDYTPATREIRISSSLADRAELFDTFAHEIGRWFEHEVAGPDAATGSVQWLSDVTGDKKAFSVKGKEGKLLQLENCSTRFWSVDDYAATVYRKNSQKNADGSWKEFYDGEALSTAFEGLLEDPEAFALDAPEHFNRLMKVLSDYRNRPK